MLHIMSTFSDTLNETPFCSRTIQDLELSIPEEEQKKNETVRLLNVSKSILPRVKQIELAIGLQSLEEGWQNLKKSIQQIQ